MAMTPARPNSRVQNFARKGRFGDTEAAHLTKGEMVIPQQVWMANPDLARHAASAISAIGADPSAYIVGHPRNSVNPKTGAREFALQYTDQGWVDPAAGYNSPIDFSTYNPNGGDQQAPEQSQATFQAPAAGTPKQANANWGPAPGSDAYYAQRAEQWNTPAPQQSFGFGGQNDQQAMTAQRQDANVGKTPNADWGPAPTPAQPTQQWGTSANQAVNQQLANIGYTGDFGGGGFDQWARQTATPAQQAQASGILQQAGQANRITWGDNGTPTQDSLPPLSYVDETGNVVTRTERPSIFDANGKPTGPIYNGPIIPGVTNPSYPIDGGILGAGQVPLAFMDPTSGVTTYQAMAHPNPTTGQGINNQYSWWDVRSGGTGDPFVAATPEWQANQAAQGNGYAAQALANAGYDLSKMVPGASSGNTSGLTSGQGTAAGQVAGSPQPAFRFGGGMAWKYPDGSIVSDEGFLLQPVGNGLFFDTGRGVLRNGTGMIVNSDGSPLTTEYSKTGHFDYQRVFGGDANTESLKWLGGRDLNELNPGGREQPIIGPYGAAYGLTPTSIPASGALASPSAMSAPMTYGTGTTTTPSVSNPQTTTTGTTTGTTTQTGSGLTAGQANPYSYPYGYSPIINVLGGQDGSTGTLDIASILAAINAGYGSSAYGQPYYTSQPAGSDTTGGGIQGVAPASDTPNFIPAFNY